MTQPAKERRNSRRSHPTPASGDKQSSSDAGDGYERGGTLASSGRTAVASAGRQLEISGTDPFFAMGILVDKLNLLNYEKGFCRAKTPHRKPLTRTFFAEDAIKTPMASGQFDFFFHLAVWLLQQAGSQLQVPKDSSPLERCTAVVQAARALGFAAPNFPAAKLAQGHGIEVIGLLESMVDVVLEKRGFKFAKPVHPTDAMVEDAEVDDEADMTRADPADVADEVGDAGDEDEDVFVAGAAPAAAQAKEHWEEEREIIEATIDPEAWRIEMERVAPRLRIVVGADQMRDWRARLETMHSHLQQIARAFPDLENLKALSKDVSGVLEKLSSREKMLNERFDVQCEEYSTSRSNLQSIQASFQKQVDVFGDQSNELAQINEQMAELQQLAQDHGNKVSDATPVVRVKNAIKQLNTELRALELRIGIVTSNLLHVRNSQAPSDAAAEAF